MKKLFRKALALSATVLLVSSTGNFVTAQLPQFCGTDEIMQNLLKTDPDVRRYHQELEAFTQEYVRTHKPEVSERGAPQYIIPLVFHIIHDNGVENLSDAMIDSAVAVLNRDYQKLNSDTSQVAPQFKHLIGDANIEFRLARKDPDGNCTDGIERIFSYRTYQGNDLSKVVIWDRKHYLNIWTVYQMATQGVAAYAYLPAGAMGLGYKVDGVISWYDYVRYNGPGPATLTHEIGHSFNLSHTWGGGQVGQTCGDDGVEDTPETNGGTTCPSNRVDFSCDSDPINKTWQFDSVTTTSGNIDPYPTYVINPSTPDTALTLMNFSAVGFPVGSNSTVASAFSFSDWGTGGVNNDTTYGVHSGNINLGKYYEFTVRPQLGQGMTLTGIRFWVKRSDTGPRMFSIRCSETSNFGSNLTSSIAPASPNLLEMRPTNIFYFVNDTSMLFKSGRVTLSGGFYSNIDDTVTFRIYAWNAEDSTGTFEIDSVAVLGTYGTIENLDNYMDYTYCDNMFTIGQTERMHAALESNISSRNNLWTFDNHMLTGIFDTDPCPPQADFYVNKIMMCQGGAGPSSVQFFDNSTRGPVTAWSWSFPNGTPSTSSAQNPTVVFNSPYSQSVTLTVSNSAGSSTVTKDNVVWVSPTWASYIGLFYEDFEDPARFNSLWLVDNRANNVSGWHVSSDGVFPSGTHGVKLNAFSPIVISTNTTPPVVLDWGIGAYDRDAFFTPNFDLSDITPNTGKLEFKLSATTRGTTAGDITDTLEVSYSINCGSTWAAFPSSTGKFFGSALSNAGSFQESYSPTLGTQWVQKSINLPSSALNSNVRFRFRYISGYFSNNIYIDDFNISGTVGIVDNNPGISADLSVYPNPASGDVSVSYRLSDSRNVTIQVFDAIGNLVYSVIDNKKQAAGNYTAFFNTSKISNGIYHIKLLGDDVTLRTEKIAIIR